MVDYNKLQSYGLSSEVLNLEPMVDKWISFGFLVREVDGHDIAALERLLALLPLNDHQPTVVICHTIKGRGVTFAEGQAEWHHKSAIKSEEIAAMNACLE